MTRSLVVRTIIVLCISLRPDNAIGRINSYRDSGHFMWFSIYPLMLKLAVAGNHQVFAPLDCYAAYVYSC